jgi:hypothetical protein
VADGRGAGDATAARRDGVTDPLLVDVLRAAGFEITEAGRQRWRRQLALPISQAALDEAQRWLDRVRRRAA